MPGLGVEVQVHRHHRISLCVDEAAKAAAFGHHHLDVERRGKCPELKDPGVLSWFFQRPAIVGVVGALRAIGHQAVPLVP